jgi:hypothetical protein
MVCHDLRHGDPDVNHEYGLQDDFPADFDSILGVKLDDWRLCGEIW